jgi:hypothetical protein
VLFKEAGTFFNQKDFKLIEIYRINLPHGVAIKFAATFYTQNQAS